MPVESNRPDLTRFPKDFLWGAATSAYQIEGAVEADGRIPSMWDVFGATPGTIVNGDTGAQACDHYHRMPEDVALMAELGLTAYRFSIAWPRITDEQGRANPAGIDFYRRLVDELLAAGIEPVVTLYHWDLPQYLAEAGGWTNRETALRMADYTTIIAGALGDRIPTWTTLNEPWCAAFPSYELGVSAPGLTSRLAALQAAHHLNLAHGTSAAALRAVLPSSAQIALTLNIHPLRPATDRAVDHEAVRAGDAVSNRIFLQPVFTGGYPDDLIADTAGVTDWSFVRDEDLATIRTRPDILGLNYYTPWVLTSAADPTPEVPREQLSRWVGTDAALLVPPAEPRNAMGWTVDPTGFRDLLLRIHDDYPDQALMVTENGTTLLDEVHDGAVADPDRISYLHGHIDALGEVIARGVDVRGYFVWSLMDNFEWQGGYTPRLGLTYVDYPTQQRIVKQSGYWYRDLITAHTRLHAG